VINLVSEEMAQAMNVTATILNSALANSLKPNWTHGDGHVKRRRIAGTLVAMECGVDADSGTLERH